MRRGGQSQVEGDDDRRANCAEQEQGDEEAFEEFAHLKIILRVRLIPYEGTVPVRKRSAFLVDVFALLNRIMDSNSSSPALCQPNRPVCQNCSRRAAR
jgi:hypothetical protein